MLRLKVTSLLLFLCISLNFVFSAEFARISIAENNTAFSSKAFSTKLFLQSHIDIINDMVNGLLNSSIKKDIPKPVENQKADFILSKDIISPSLSSNIQKIDPYKSYGKSNLIFSENINSLNKTSHLSSLFKESRCIILGICIYLLSYLSLLYRDSWLNIINIEKTKTYNCV